MKTQNYAVNQYQISSFLAWVQSGEIAIPEIQRPFVWRTPKVRDLMDSLYQGYPIGYLISWRNPNVKLKDGTSSEGKKILIDGQQRIMAMKAAILGHQVIDKRYRRKRIRIAFQPLEERFEVLNNAIKKDSLWIDDISPLVSGTAWLSKVKRAYCEANPEADEFAVEKSLENLKQITTKQVGLIELDPDLSIDTVTEIFIRINSMGVVLSQADFAMSKIAASEEYGGSDLRKCIDYFCHLAVAPEFYQHIADHETEFSKSEYFKKMKWLQNETDDLYDPKYGDLLRVAFTSEFERGRLADLVSLLSGRNFETRTFEEEIAIDSFATLETGILNFMNETNFKRFVMIIKSAGFIEPWLIRSKSALNFAYIVYLKLRSQGINQAEIESFVRRWFVLAVLTGRYSGSPESQFDFDIRTIARRPFGDFLADVESAELSEAFWKNALVQNLDTSVASSPNWHVYVASQVKSNDKGFLSRDITVTDLITHRGDIHHIFPKGFLTSYGLKRGRYNQIANYAYMQSEINIRIGKRAPNDYFQVLEEQVKNGETSFGAINNVTDLKQNLAQHCIPASITDMGFDDYDTFLDQRRRLMAQKIQGYYFSL
jgi:hypothetical protein